MIRVKRQDETLHVNMRGSKRRWREKIRRDRPRSRHAKDREDAKTGEREEGGEGGGEKMQKVQMRRGNTGRTQRARAGNEGAITSRKSEKEWKNKRISRLDTAPGRRSGGEGREGKSREGGCGRANDVDEMLLSGGHVTRPRRIEINAFASRIPASSLPPPPRAPIISSSVARDSFVGFPSMTRPSRPVPSPLLRQCLPIASPRQRGSRDDGSSFNPSELYLIDER